MEEKIKSNYKEPFFEWGKIYDKEYGFQKLNKDKIKQYVNNKPLKKGDEMIIYNGQGCLHEYILAEVIEPHYGKKGYMVQLSKGAGSASCEPLPLNHRFRRSFYYFTYTIVAICY